MYLDNDNINARLYFFRMVEAQIVDNVDGMVSLRPYRANLIDIKQLLNYEYRWQKYTDRAMHYTKC